MMVKTHGKGVFIMYTENTCWSQSVAAVCIREGKVLLARHTYGPGIGKLIIPGGYIEKGELPQDAVRREYMEEAGVVIEPKGVIGIRFSQKDWYVVFAADYVSGAARADGDENSEVVWMDTDEALLRDDVPELTKKLIGCALADHHFDVIPYKSTTTPFGLYGAK